VARHRISAPLRRASAIALLVPLTLAVAACGEAKPIVVQVRWCVMEGSSEAAEAAPGDLVSTFRADGDALAKANEIWAEAGLLFLSVVAEQDGVKGVPVINDPDEHRDSGELDGDIDGIDTFESAMAALECHRSWQRLDDSLEGPVIVTVRRFINAGETLGGASQPPFELWISNGPGTGQRGDDLCGEPRSLASDDLFEIDGSSTDHVDVGWALVAEPEQYRNLSHRGRGVAHELGHVLSLAHGNGLDDNHDGGAVGSDGPRRFDEYCDPLGTAEDDLSGDQPCTSVMERTASCELLTDLQIEQARAAAAAMPGCAGPCN
jgi:hypothetical protein